MDLTRKDKFWAIIGGISMVGLYIAALMSNDLSTWERDYLHGAKWLLDRTSMYYLPIFPLVSGISSIFSESKKTILPLAVTNCLLTLAFMLFAYSTDILKQTWFCLFLGSVVFLVIAIHDTKCEKQRREINKTATL